MADLFERIDKLNDQLSPLAGKQRGMRIEAGEWNTLIDVLRGLLAIDRAQEQVVEAGLADNFARKDHQHLQQVATDWLDAELRASLGDGGGATSSARIALTDLRKWVDSLKSQLTELAGTLAEQGRRIDQSATSELDRTRLLRGFESRFGGLEDLRTNVVALNGRLNGISGNLETVLSLRERLTDESGAPIDVAGLRQSVAGLEKLRENLTGADGTLLRLRDLALGLNEVRDALDIAGDNATSGLDRRITLAVGAAEERLDSNLQTRLAAQSDRLRSENLQAAEALRGDVDGRLSALRAEDQQLTDAKLTTLEERLVTRGDERLAGAGQAIRADLLAAAGAQTAAALAVVPARVDQAVAAVRAELANGLRGELAASLGERLSSALGAAETRLGERVDGVEERFADLTAALPSNLDARFAAARAGLAEELTQRMSAQLGASLEASAAEIRATLRGALVEQVRVAVGDLDARIGDALGVRLADIDARLAASVDRAMAGVPAMVGDALQREIATLNLDARFATLETRLSNQFRAEMRDALVNERLRSATELNNSVALLRQEIDSARVSATNDAVRLSQARTNTSTTPTINSGATVATPVRTGTTIVR